LENKTSNELYDGLLKIVNLYKRAGFKIISIHCDQEFRPLMDEVGDKLVIDLNYTTTKEHVPEAKRNNRTIKERIRSTYHLLPYKAIPRTMIRHLAMVSTEQLNMFPTKGGVSSYYSPHVILSGQALDFEKH
jgi:hypothetical protein